MTDWSIRRATAVDAVSLAASIEAAYAVYAERGVALPAVSDGVADDIRDNLVWVVELGGRIVGGLVLVPRTNHALLANVAVDPMVTGRGIGRALLDRAEQEAGRLGLEKLRLNTHVDIPENVRLYEHLGWRETGRAGDKVSMEKPLARKSLS